MNTHARPAPNPVVTVGNVKIGNALPLAIIAGPCQLESREHAFEMATALKEMTAKAGVGLVYKTSFDKANRTSISGKRGMGLEKSLQIFADLRAQLGLPILTDIHEREQCAIVAEVVDVLQIPAFLSRQTDLIVAAANTGKVVNVKKGQFLAPWDMKNVIAKVTDAGNPNVLVTERGASFGYNTLVVDMTGLPEMAKFGAPVVMDATHAVQKPGGQGTSTGGNRDMAPYIARAAVAAGVAAVFLETHQDPDHAPSDGPNMLDIKTVPALLSDLVAIDAIVKRQKA
jgi:2-dehydro-3-deoxyphosphooctonate aldolase (KDO 8-P synthase)